MWREWTLHDGLILAGHCGYKLGQSLRLLTASQAWSAAQIKEHQGRALRALVRHCYDHVPYYRNVMLSRGLAPEDFQTREDVAKLPYLTKEIIREQKDRLRADNYPDALCLFRRSGGTTGEPIRVAVDARCRAFETAAILRGLGWMKYQPGKPAVRLFGGSLGVGSGRTWKAKLRSWLMNDRFLSAFEITAENARHYHDVILKAKGSALIGYASAILNLVEYMSRLGLRGSPLRSVIYTAEHMPHELRPRISDALQAPVFAYYGGGEIHSIAYECEGEAGYLVCQEHIILEAAGNAPERFQEEGRGEACVTALFNYAMPMIRYLNGDVLELRPAASGRAHQRIACLEGRIMDQLSATDGHAVSSALPAHFVLRSGLPVWKYQVVQTTLDEIVFHYMTADEGALSREAQEVVTAAFRRFLGSDLQVRFVYGEFETTVAGKHRFVINRTLSTGKSPQSGDCAK